MGRFGAKQVLSGNAQVELQKFLAPELKESTLSKKDEAYMIEAMVHEGFDWSLFVSSTMAFIHHSFTKLDCVVVVGNR